MSAGIRNPLYSLPPCVLGRACASLLFLPTTRPPLTCQGPKQAVDCRAGPSADHAKRERTKWHGGHRTRQPCDRWRRADGPEGRLPGQQPPDSGPAAAHIASWRPGYEPNGIGKFASPLANVTPPQVADCRLAHGLWTIKPKVHDRQM